MCRFLARLDRQMGRGLEEGRGMVANNCYDKSFSQMPRVSFGAINPEWGLRSKFPSPAFYQGSLSGASALSFGLRALNRGSSLRFPWMADASSP